MTTIPKHLEELRDKIARKSMGMDCEERLLFDRAFNAAIQALSEGVGEFDEEAAKVSGEILSRETPLDKSFEWFFFVAGARWQFENDRARIGFQQLTIKEQTERFVFMSHKLSEVEARLAESERRLSEFSCDENWLIESEYADRPVKSGRTDWVYIGQWDPRVFASKDNLPCTKPEERKPLSEFYKPSRAYSELQSKLASTEALLAESERECEQQALLNGKGSERESGLRAKLASTEALYLESQRINEEFVVRHRDDLDKFAAAEAQSKARWENLHEREKQINELKARVKELEAELLQRRESK